jgi:hypothetical protein
MLNLMPQATTAVHNTALEMDGQGKGILTSGKRVFISAEGVINSQSFL